MASFFFLTQIYIKHKNKFKSMNNKKKVRLFFKSLLMQLAEVETDRAKLIFDAPELKEGVEVFVESDGENEDYIPAPDGDYKTNDGKTIKVANGVVAEIIDDNAEVAPEKPEEVKDFVEKTGVDSLAISIGTSHGRCKFKPEQCTRNADGVLVPPPLAFDVLEEIEKKLPGFPIVLHGSSSVPVEYVKEIEQYGGKLADSVGIPEEQLRKAAKSAVCKINIDSDGRLAMTAAIRKVFATNPSEFDPRKYLGPARDELKKLYMHKNIEVLGSANHLD